MKSLSYTEEGRVITAIEARELGVQLDSIEDCTGVKSKLYSSKILVRPSSFVISNDDFIELDYDTMYFKRH